MLEEYFSRIDKGCSRTPAGERIGTAHIRRGLQPQTIVRSRALTPAAQIPAALLNRCTLNFDREFSISAKVKTRNHSWNLSQRMRMYRLLFVFPGAPLGVAVDAESGYLAIKIIQQPWAGYQL
jgi:hypothetical protein